MAGFGAGVLVSGDRQSIFLAMGIILASTVGGVEDFHGLHVFARLALTSASAITITIALGTITLAPGITGLIITGVLVFWIVGVVNAVNFMDGIDGLSALIAIVVGAAYAAIGLLTDIFELVVLGSLLAVTAVAFAPYNVHRASVFLGDIGSYGIGACLAVMSTITVAKGLPMEIALGPLALYLADTGCTIVRRIWTGEKWHAAHREHVYQRLVTLGYSHSCVALTLASLTTACSLLSIVSISGDLQMRLIADSAALIIVVLYLNAPRLLSWDREFA
jgi:UDP-N-acetylmuramyl pentapeptide phosphotransferase/UDP-N-acetylglucosamine-1-phosphate transferase